MDNRDFFNKLAFQWDNMCKHDEEKLEKILNLSEVKENSNILDVGTGTGVLIKYLLKTSPMKITAVDISENMIEVAKSKYKGEKVEFIIKDINRYNDKNFDYIFLYSVYPHFKDKEATLRHLRKLLNKGGKIIIAHSDSKEKINKVHSRNEIVKEDKLPSVEVTARIMEKYLTIEKMIDNENMYYISGVKV
ncbi:class I SAM-dependent methyltransferase [Clostridium tetanomorphum]|uniref:Class I SAM-dependent methyltransferase n=1 Tax=Clostridium tetanomorphum TaxID=1553 RepID=A0A923EBU9_CLOTT|nr:class I SAM-dependent methyltransferase [Clostridium tetanomorphum]MBC2397535.1 class I SAM-dependent methyltransferase [Clostridium tetanomorphum]NRZ95713.1 demethylmenaquinone methyltransferase/2-methoxy-6-polyprenyl-1,4-benzoquinol methylase [Clostridium tetanomorphum]